MFDVVIGVCCTPDTPCTLGEGDCENDSDCQDDLVTNKPIPTKHKPKSKCMMTVLCSGLWK